MRNKMFILVLAMVLLACPLQAITKEEGGSLVFFNELSEEQTFKGDNFDIRLDKNSIATIKTNEDGSKILELSGTGTINVKDQHSLNNIGNATIIIGAGNEIEYAAFISLKDQLFKFIYEKEEISITANSGSKILYDTKNRKLSGNNLESINYKDKNIKSSQGLTEINFNEETNDIVEIILPPKSQYSNNGFIYSSESAFKIYLDGRDIKKSKENVVSTFENLISSKGKIRIENKEAKIVYEGNDKEVYTEYNSEIQTFDIKSGDVKISNGISTTEIKNNREMLDLKKGIAESFSYRYSLYKGKEENVYYTQINQAEDGNLKVVSFKDDKENIIAVYSFGEGLNNIGLMGMERIIGEIKSLRAKDTKKDIAPYLPPEEFSQLQAIDKKITELKETNEEIPKELLEGKDILELKNMQGEVERLMEDDRENEAWGKVNQYLKEERSVEASALGNLELYGVFETMKDEKYKKLAEKSFQKAVDVYKELKKDEEKKEDATLKLGSLFLQTGKLNEASSEFDEIMSSSDNKEAVSIAQVGKAMIKLNQNLPEAALINLKKAIETDENNQNAQELYKNLQTNILHTIRDSKYKQFEQQYVSFNEKWNLGGAELTNTLNFIAAEFGVMKEDIEKLEKKEEHTGASALGVQFLSKLAEKGVDLEELSKITPADRKKIISKTFGIESLNEQEVTSLFLSKTSEERRALIKNSLGYEPDFDKLPDNLASNWLAYSNVRRELLMKEKGEGYVNADKTLNDIAFLTLAAERDWDTALVIAGGNVKKAKEILKDKGMTEGEINEKSRLMEFDFKTGRDYDEASNIEKTWKNSVAGAINIKNAAWFLVPGAVAGRAAPLLKYVPGAIRAVEGTATLKNELMLNRLITSEWVAKNMPALATKYEGILAKSAGLVSEELREEAVESFIFGQIGGNTAELVSAYTPMLRAGKYPIVSKIFEFNGEKLAGFEFENKEVLDSFMQQSQIKKLTDDVFEVNGKRFVAVVGEGWIKTPGLKVLFKQESSELTTAPKISDTIRDSARKVASFWTKRPPRYEITDSNGNVLGSIVLPTKAQELRVMAKLRDINRGGEIGGSITDFDSELTTTEIIVLRGYDLLKKEEIFVTSAKRVEDLPSSFKELTDHGEDLNNFLIEIEKDIGARDLSAFGFEGIKFNELSAVEKEQVLDRIKPLQFRGEYGLEWEDPFIQELGHKYGERLDNLRDTTRKLLYDWQIEPRDYGIKKSNLNVGTMDMISITKRAESPRMILARMGVTRPRSSSIDFHTHPISTSELGSFIGYPQSARLSSLIKSRVEGDYYSGERISSKEFEAEFNEAKEDALKELKNVEKETYERLEVSKDQIQPIREQGKEIENFLIKLEDKIGATDLTGFGFKGKKFSELSPGEKDIVLEKIKPAVEGTPEPNELDPLIQELRERYGERLDDLRSKTRSLFFNKGIYPDKYGVMKLWPEVTLTEASDIFKMAVPNPKSGFESEEFIMKKLSRIDELKQALEGNNIESSVEKLAASGFVLSPYYPSVQDAQNLLIGQNWLKVGDGPARMKVGIILEPSTLGRSLLVQLENDPNLLFIRDVGNSRLVSRIPIEEVKKMNPGDALVPRSSSIQDLTKMREETFEALRRDAEINKNNKDVISAIEEGKDSGRIAATPETTTTSSTSLKSPGASTTIPPSTPQNQNDFLQEYFVQAGAKVTIIDSDTMAFQAKGTREITWSMSQAQDFFKVHGPGTQGVKVVKGVQTPNDGFDISEVNRIQTEAIQKAANLKKIPGTVTIHAKNQKNIWRTLIFPVDKNGQINLRHADFK